MSAPNAAKRRPSRRQQAAATRELHRNMRAMGEAPRPATSNRLLDFAKEQAQPRLRTQRTCLHRYRTLGPSFLLLPDPEAGLCCRDCLSAVRQALPDHRHGVCTRCGKPDDHDSYLVVSLGYIAVLMVMCDDCRTDLGATI